MPVKTESTPPPITSEDTSDASPTSNQSSPTAPSGSRKKKATPTSPSKKKKSKGDDEPTRGYSRWDKDVDLYLLRCVDELVKDHLWAKAKMNGKLLERGSTGVKYRWAAKIKKMIKDVEGDSK